MPAYDFRCKTCNVIEEVTRPMSEAGEPHYCVTCGSVMARIFFAAPDIWNTDGAHKTDYGKGNTVGTKADALNKAWSKHYGEAPPPPATDISPNRK